jgi:hypothetical protein
MEQVGFANRLKLISIIKRTNKRIRSGLGSTETKI